METRYRTVHRRKRRTLKSVWGALAGLSFLMMAASMCAAALFAWLAGWME